MLGRSLRAGPVQTLSANSVNAYGRPLRSLAIWLVDEGLLALNPFRRSRRRAALNPLLPSEETPTKGATLGDLRALEDGCRGERPIDRRDQAIVAVLVTTAARNSSVRLLRLADIDLPERSSDSAGRRVARRSRSPCTTRSGPCSCAISLPAGRHS